VSPLRPRNHLNKIRDGRASRFRRHFGSVFWAKGLLIVLGDPDLVTARRTDVAAAVASQTGVGHPLTDQRARARRNDCYG
jgi:hypothetical protein